MPRHFLPSPFRHHHTHGNTRYRPLLLACVCLGIPICLLAVGLIISRPSKVPAVYATETTTQTVHSITSLPGDFPTVTPPSENLSTEDLTAYYDTLIQELNRMLLNERTDRFVMEYTYEQEIERLEGIVSELEERINGMGGAIETPPVEENTEPTQATPPAAENDSDVNTEGEGSPSPENEVYTYDIVDGGAVIRAYQGSSRHAVIPAILGGVPVTAIGDNVFKNTDVVSVTLPETITSVGWFAFYGCQDLKAVVVPASVSRIDYAAFDGCPSITVICPADSYAARYAAAFGINYSNT